MKIEITERHTCIKDDKEKEKSEIGINDGKKIYKEGGYRD